MLVVNVHLDHTEDVAVKQTEMRAFIDLLGGIAGVPPAGTIVMGDGGYVRPSPRGEPAARAGIKNQLPSGCFG